MPGITALPDGLAAPARRALATAGISSLEELSRRTEREIAALHGIGGNALATLRAALAASGSSFAERRLGPGVQEYVDALGPEHRRLFDRLHALILDVGPHAEVVIAYQIPLYRVGKLHVGLNARRPDGVTLTTTSPDHIAEYQRRHPRAATNKASIKFAFDDVLDESAIRAVVRRATTP